MILRLSAVKVEAAGGEAGDSFLEDDLSCAMIAARSWETALAGDGLVDWLCVGRYEVMRRGILDDREVVRWRPADMEPDQRRFKILAMFCS